MSYYPDQPISISRVAADLDITQDILLDALTDPVDLPLARAKAEQLTELIRELQELSIPQ